VKAAFNKSFVKDLRKIDDRAILQHVHDTIKAIEIAQRPADIKNLRKLSGEHHHYRIRIGDYRIGLIIQGETVTFVRILHRRDLYRYFP
jgi:mRNA interferase RelE/StbE